MNEYGKLGSAYRVIGWSMPGGKRVTIRDAIKGWEAATDPEDSDRWLVYCR